MGEASGNDLLTRIQQGDEPASFELMDRYAERLIALARKRVSKKLARRIDPEDIVQSACRSFFRHAKAGRYAVRDSDDLWRLLAAITVHKALRQVRRHSVAKRDFGKEDSCGRDASIQAISPHALSRDPSPDEAAMFVEETELMMAGLSPSHRQIVEFTLQGHDVPEAAEKAGCSERTVQRALELGKQLLEHRLRGSLIANG